MHTIFKKNYIYIDIYMVPPNMNPQKKFYQWTFLYDLLQPVIIFKKSF